MTKFNKNFLNNIKVKHKLILIYIICVVAPIIIINFIFYQYMMTNVKENNKNYYKLSTQRIATEIYNDLNSIINLTTKISLDQKLYEMLDKTYQTNLEYAETYYDYFQPYLYLNGESYEQVNRAIIYTSNPTILNSGVVHKIENQHLKQQWFKKIISSPNKLHVIYGESEKNADNTIRTPISIYKVLKEFQGLDRYMKIIKIELYSKNIVDIINSENIKGHVSILDSNGSILFSDNSLTNSQRLTNPLKFDEESTIQSTIGKNFNWKIINIIDLDDLEMALREPRSNIIFLTLISLFLSSLIILLIYRSFYVRLNALSEHVNNLDQEDFSRQYNGPQGKDEIGSLIRAYNRMVRKIKTLVMDVYEAKIERSNIKLGKKQAEINALQSQMNPHFLFNTLESIRMKSVEKGEKDTAEIIKYLARSFRRMISFQQEWIDVSEEVTYIKEFLKIQKYRFGSEFEYTLDVDPDTFHVRIPKLIIQPFVENACIHGIERSEDCGEVLIKIEIINDSLKCIIRDNGIGIKKERLEYILKHLQDENLSDTNIGIENIYKRLNLYYGDKFDLFIESEESVGTTIKLIIPLEVKNV